jgi:hypothetical protein
VTINVPNPEALKAGIAHAQDHLNLWDQNEFLTYWDDDGEWRELPEEGEPPCGTTACLAGHILLAAGKSWKQISQMDIPNEALRVLGFEQGRHFGDGDLFDDRVFLYTHDDSGLLAKTQEKFDLFKAHVTEVTGIEL